MKKLTMPAALKNDAVAKVKWRELIALPLWRNAADKLGADLVAEYCLLYARRMKAEEAMREQGELATTPNGYKVQSAWLTVANRAAADMLSISRFVSATTVEPGKKQLKQIAAAEASGGKFAPTAPPKLVHSR